MKNLILTTHEELVTLIEQALSKFMEPKNGTASTTSSILSIDEASTYLQIPKGTIYQLTHRREIPFHKVGRSLKFTKKGLDEWLETTRKKTRKEILLNS